MSFTYSLSSNIEDLTLQSKSFEPFSLYYAGLSVWMIITFFFFSVEDCMAGDVNLFLNDNKLDIAEIEVMIAGIFLIACR